MSDDIPTAISTDGSSTARSPILIFLFAAAAILLALDDGIETGAQTSSLRTLSDFAPSILVAELESATKCSGTDIPSGVLATPSLSHTHAFSCSPHSLAALSTGSRSSRDGPFLPGGGCSLHWYSASEACACVKRSRRQLIFIGDSLLRHLGQALFNVLSGDFVFGGVQQQRFEGNPQLLLQCSCDNAFIDRNALDGARTNCLLNSMVYADNSTQVLVCGSRKLHSNFFTFLEWYSPELWYEGTLDATLQSLLSRIASDFEGRALIIISVGLHGNLNSDTIFPLVHQSIFDAAAMGGDVQVLCLTVHAPQANKPSRWTVSQGPEAVREWNRKLRIFCEGAGGKILDTHALTEDATSFDGTHYAGRVNYLLAQVLLNHIADIDHK